MLEYDTTIDSDETGRAKEWLENTYNATFGSGGRKFAKQYSFDTPLYSTSRFPDNEVQITTEYSMDIHFPPVGYDRFMHDMNEMGRQIDELERIARYHKEREKTEKALREKNPALDKAYKNYHTLLRLVDNGKATNEK